MCLTFFVPKERGIQMAKIKMTVANDITFYEGGEEYILDCKARNLRNLCKS